MNRALGLVTVLLLEPERGKLPIAAGEDGTLLEPKGSIDGGVFPICTANGPFMVDPAASDVDGGTIRAGGRCVTDIRA